MSEGIAHAGKSVHQSAPDEPRSEVSLRGRDPAAPDQPAALIATALITFIAAVEQKQLVGHITRRSKVQVLPPQPTSRHPPMPTDQRSTEARAWRKLYDLPQWRGPHGARQAQLKRQPLCERCHAEGRITPATVVNHRKPHKGNLDLFLDPANHESCCAAHHDSVIQSEERTGKVKPIVGVDGWPAQ